MYMVSNQIGQQQGYIKVSELSDRKKYRRILKAVDAGELVKVRHGVYAPPEELLANMIDVESIVPGGVVCLFNAWAYYGLSTVVPPEFCIAISAKRKVSLNTPFPIKLFYWKDDNLKFGINVINVSNYHVYITDLERSVCDAIKYRNKIGFALCSEIIRNYAKRADHNLSRLSEYAKILRVEKTIKEYMTIALGE